MGALFCLVVFCLFVLVFVFVFLKGPLLRGLEPLLGKSSTTESRSRSRPPPFWLLKILPGKTTRAPCLSVHSYDYSLKTNFSKWNSWDRLDTCCQLELQLSCADLNVSQRCVGAPLPTVTASRKLLQGLSQPDRKRGSNAAIWEHNCLEFPVHPDLTWPLLGWPSLFSIGAASLIVFRICVCEYICVYMCVHLYIFI